MTDLDERALATAIRRRVAELTGASARVRTEFRRSRIACVVIGDTGYALTVYGDSSVEALRAMLAAIETTAGSSGTEPRGDGR